MIEELNNKLKSMYLEPKTKLRVDVDYVVGRLETIVDVATQHRIDADSVVDGFDYLNKDIVITAFDFLRYSPLTF